MARPEKVGVDYFPLDTELDMKFDLIEAEFGLVGYAITIKLFQKIYGENGYYMSIDDEILLLLSVRFHVEKQLVNDIINGLIRRGIFDELMYTSHKILTSAGIQKRYLEITKRRKEVTLDDRFLLVEIGKKDVNSNINLINVCDNSINSCKSTQRKGKESKGKESKGKKSVDARTRETTHTLFSSFKNVSLSDWQHTELESNYQRADDLIEKVGEYLANSTKAYQNHYALIKKIARDDGWPKKPKPKIENVPENPKEAIILTDAELNLAREKLMNAIGGE